jgi:phosphohistidine phosphatase SixA
MATAPAILGRRASHGTEQVHMHPRSGLLALVLFALCAGPAAAERAATSDAAWTALAEGGHVALTRHARAPGRTPDPPGFRVEDCATQRGLDDRGRADAAALGAEFRRNAVKVARTLSSPWCRCLETARLMGYTPEISDALYNLMGPNPDRDRQRRDFRAIVSGWRGPDTLLLVSHGVTIRFLTDLYPAEGEVIVLAPAPDEERGFRIVGRVAPPA